MSDRYTTSIELTPPLSNHTRTDHAQTLRMLVPSKTGHVPPRLPSTTPDSPTQSQVEQTSRIVDSIYQLCGVQPEPTNHIKLNPEMAELESGTNRQDVIASLQANRARRVPQTQDVIKGFRESESSIKAEVARIETLNCEIATLNTFVSQLHQEVENTQEHTRTQGEADQLREGRVRTEQEHPRSQYQVSKLEKELEDTIRKYMETRALLIRLIAEVHSILDQLNKNREDTSQQYKIRQLRRQVSESCPPFESPATVTQDEEEAKNLAAEDFTSANSVDVTTFDSDQRFINQRKQRELEVIRHYIIKRPRTPFKSRTKDSSTVYYEVEAKKKHPVYTGSSCDPGEPKLYGFLAWWSAIDENHECSQTIAYLCSPRLMYHSEFITKYALQCHNRGTNADRYGMQEGRILVVSQNYDVSEVFLQRLVRLDQTPVAGSLERRPTQVELGLRIYHELAHFNDDCMQLLVQGTSNATFISDGFDTNDWSFSLLPSSSHQWGRWSLAMDIGTRLFNYALEQDLEQDLWIVCTRLRSGKIPNILPNTYQIKNTAQIPVTKGSSHRPCFVAH